MGPRAHFEWKGFIPFERTAVAFNPPSGMIVTANQNPFPPDYAYPVQATSRGTSADQIRDLLSARKGWKAEEMIAVQKDVYSSFDHFLAGELVRPHTTPQCVISRASTP